MRTRVPRHVASLSCLLAVSLLGTPLAAGAHGRPGRAIVAAPLALPAGAVRTGTLAPSARLSLRLVLRPRDESALRTFIARASTPGTPTYGHYLTRGAFAARFGPTLATLDAVRAALRAAGLSVTGVAPSRLVLMVTGPAAAAARLLGVRFDRYRLADGAPGYAAVGTPTLPATLAGDVAGLAGTTSLDVVHSFAVPGRSTRSGTVHAVASPRSGPTACQPAQQALQEYPGTFSPAQEGQAYGLDTAWNAGDLGQGRSVALVEFAPYAMSDVLAYDHCFGMVPSNQSSDPNLRNVLVDGGTSPGSSGASDEPTLDIEEVRALAPDANVVVYEGPNNVLGPLDTLQRIATDDSSAVVSTSWGICEQLSDHAAEAPVFQQLAAQGQTVFAASGDSGSSDCFAQSPGSGPPVVGPDVDDPASQPLVTGVGALTVTSLASNSSQLRETVWNDCTAQGSPGCLGGASGGGASNYAPRPAWQVGPGVPTAGQLGAGRRDVPDLTVMGDPATGMLAYYEGTFTPYGGTSMGAPLLAALDAVATDACSTTTFGFLNPLLYSMSTEPGAFNDVTTGTNAIAPSTVAHHQYVAHANYDLASGIGSPGPTGFIADLCGGLATAVAAPTTPENTSTWTISFHAGAVAYTAGTTVTLSAPPGTQLPGSPADWQVTTPSGTTQPSAVRTADGPGSTEANLATLTLAGGAPAHGAIGITASNVANPPLVGTAHVTIRDSVDALAPVAALALQASSPTQVQLRVVTGTTATTPLDAAGIALRAIVTDASGNAVAGATLSVQTSAGAVARLASVRTDDRGTASLVVRDDRIATALVAVTAGGVASGSVEVRFTDPWRTTHVAALEGLGALSAAPSVAPGTHRRFVALVRTRNARLGVVVGTASGATAVPLRVTGTLWAAASAPSLARVGGDLVAAYRSTRGHLVVAWTPARSPRAAWAIEDLTAAGVSPPLAGPPGVVASGHGASSLASVAAVDTSGHVVVLRAPLRDLARYALLDVTALARAPTALAGSVAQVPVGGAMGYVVALRDEQLVVLGRNGGHWLADNLANDALLFGPAANSIGDAVATTTAGQVEVVAMDASGQLVAYVGTLGNWSATVLSTGPAGTSAPAGEHGLAALSGVPSLLTSGSDLVVAATSRGGRLYEVTSQGVTDPYAAYDLTSLGALRAACSGAAFVAGTTRALLAVVGGHLVLLRH